MVASTRTIAVRAVLASMAMSVVITAGAATITGRVVDETGRGMSGIDVSAYIEQEACCAEPIAATRSGANGNFVLDVPPGTCNGRA